MRVTLKGILMWNRRANLTSAMLALMSITWCIDARAQERSRRFSAQDLSGILEEARAEKKMPGLRAAIRYADGHIVRAAVGLGDREANTPLDNDVGMPGGSSGKTFVAALAMLLVEDGTLSLDAPISRWFSQSEWYARLPNANRIKVRHLLSHSSGIPDYSGNGRYRRAMILRVLRNGCATFEPEELIDYSITKEKPPFDPGKGFRYSDPGYLVLGRVIEAVSGRDYYDLLQERILEPHGLSDIRPQNEPALPNIVPGYFGGSGRNLKKDGRMKVDPSNEWTGGGLVTTPTMLVKFFGALAEGRVVQPETLELMLEGEWQDPKVNWRYGYGLFVYDDGTTKGFGHAGMWSGYRTDVSHFVSSGLTIAVQTNRDGSIGLDKLILRLASVVEHSEKARAKPETEPPSVSSNPAGSPVLYKNSIGED